MRNIWLLRNERWHMSKSTAERQREYRARRPENDDRRLNTWISAKADLALERLARHNGQSKRETLERLVLDADEQVLKTLDLDTPEWDQYFASRAQLLRNAKR